MVEVDSPPELAYFDAGQLSDREDRGVINKKNGFRCENRAFLRGVLKVGVAAVILND